MTLGNTYRDDFDRALGLVPGDENDDVFAKLEQELSVLTSQCGCCSRTLSGRGAYVENGTLYCADCSQAANPRVAASPD